MAGDFAVAAIALVIAGYLMMRLHLFLASVVFLVRAWRWFSGNTWHGEPVTDAGWLRPGRRVLIKVGHASRWHHLPRLHRAAWRTGGTVGVLGVIWGLLAAPAITLALLAAVFLAALTVAGAFVIRVLANRRHRRTWLHPLHLAAHELAGHPKAIAAKSWITAEVDAAGGVNKATLALPPGFPADEKDKTRLVSIASQKLGIEAAEPSWRLAGPTPMLTLTHSPPPPGHVSMADLLKELPNCRDDELLIGIGKNDSIIKASLGTDSPHIAISMGTGAGKSNLAGWLLLQILLRGGIGLVLDAKRRLSYPWILKDADRNVVQLPNVAYAWRVAEMHAAMAWLSKDLDRRGDVAFAGMDTGGKVHANVGPRLFTLAEELNMAVPRLRAYWQEIRGPDDPTKSPAFTGLGEDTFAGRQVRKHVVLVGQMLTAEVTGSKDSSVKENCGIMALARYGPKGWRIMAEDVPMPPPPTVLGRVQLVTGRQAREVQTPELDPWEARRLVLASDMALLPYDMPCRPVGPATVSGRPALDTPSDLRPETVSVAPPRGPVTLQEALRLGVLHPSTTIASLRMARHRDPDFPGRRGVRGRDYLYDAAELAAYDEARRS